MPEFVAPGHELELPSSPEITAADLRTAVARANDIPRRKTPHRLAVHHAKEAEPEIAMEREEDQAAPSAQHPGILYGTWWHEFVETIPWAQPGAAWQRKFDEAQVRSPQPERSAREWELFRNSELARWLAEPGRIIQVEMPFLWQEADRTCLEGVMDLAVFTPGEGLWRVIDWKTNRFAPEGGAGLKDVYRGQILAYMRALKEILRAEVRGSLYLTQSGEWLEMEEA